MLTEMRAEMRQEFGRDVARKSLRRKP